MTTVLVINSGSSSLKCKVIDTDSGDVKLNGHVDGIGIDSCKVKIDNLEESRQIKDHTEAINVIMGHVDKTSLDAVGHRVVHGGEKYAKTVEIDDKVIETIRELSSLAPLHNPANLQGILACRKVLGDLPQVAVFDTAFHQTIPEHAYLYGVPKTYYEVHGVRKYGFHGTSHKFVAFKAREKLDLESANLITCHIGNGSSITAINDNKSIDTSMGFTPMPGVVMGTRCGDLDPGVIGFLQDHLHMDCDGIMHLLNKKSGLFGLAGSSDMRDLHAREREGDADARKAIDKLAYGIAGYIGSYLNKLGRVDGIIFTAGLGENAFYLRRRVFEFIPGAGITLDDDKNAANEEVVSSPDSVIPVLVIPTDEELQIALETRHLLS